MCSEHWGCSSRAAGDSAKLPGERGRCGGLGGGSGLASRRGCRGRGCWTGPVRMRGLLSRARPWLTWLVEVWEGSCLAQVPACWLIQGV